MIPESRVKMFLTISKGPPPSLLLSTHGERLEKGVEASLQKELAKALSAVVNGRSLGISELAVPTDRREGWMEADCLVSGWLERERDSWSQGKEEREARTYAGQWHQILFLFSKMIHIFIRESGKLQI